MKPAGLIGPIILISVGFLFLINNLGFQLPLRTIFREFWPFLLILLGVLQLVGGTFGGGVRSHGSLTGGLMLITIGGLFALQTLLGISFRQTWPVILIAVGVAGFLRFTGVADERGGRWSGGFRR